MKRRQFIAALGGAAAWPLGARGEHREPLRRIGVLMNLREDDPESVARIAAFRKALAELGWTEGRNLRIDYRWGAGDPGGFRRHAEELVALGPDVILANATPTVSALLQVTRTVPIVFVAVIDPVGAGFVASLSRPGGNATGFTSHEFSISAKWLELLKELAPHVTRAGVLRDPSSPTGVGQLASIQSVAPALGVELTPIGVQNAREIESGIAAFVRSPRDGLIVTPSSSSIRHRNLIIALAAQHRLPSVYAARYFANEGGLVSYGPDRVEQYPRAAAYVDRILKGEQPGDLPVQVSTAFALVINLKTAKAIGLEISPTLLARADEVIE